MKFHWVNKIKDEFLLGGHLQSLGVAGIVYASLILLNLDISFLILALSYLIFYPIYLNDRLRDMQSDEETNPKRTAHYRKYIRLMPIIILSSILLSLIILIYIGNLNLILFSSTIIILGFLYPYYFKKITKRIIGFKNIFVSLFFTAMVLLPIFFYQLDYSNIILPFLILMILVFIKSFLMQVLLDCKDIKSDKSIGLLTIPSLIGKKRSLAILAIANPLITSLILISSLFFVPNFNSKMIFILLTIPLNLYSYQLAYKNRYSGYILGSGEFFTWLIIFIVADIF